MNVEETAQATVIKRGEIMVDTVLHRSMGGLFVSVKAHPSIEEFMRGLGDGSAQDVRGFGRYWTPKTKGTTLYTYALGPQQGVSRLSNHLSYRFDTIGQPLTSTQQNGPGGELMTTVNIAFLRLLGVSEGHGVDFRVDGVYTLEAVERMRDQIGEAQKAFYKSYLKPIDASVQLQLNSQDIAL